MYLLVDSSAFSVFGTPGAKPSYLPLHLSSHSALMKELTKQQFKALYLAKKRADGAEKVSGHVASCNEARSLLTPVNDSLLKLENSSEYGGDRIRSISQQRLRLEVTVKNTFYSVS